jgi:flagellar motor switch protein FliN/FliY
MADDEKPDEETPGDAAAEAPEGESGDEIDDDAMAAEWEAAAAEGGDGGGDADAMAAEWDAAAGGGEGDAGTPGHGEEAVYEVPVEISAVLGTAQIPVSQLLKMGRGAVLELDRLVGDPVDIYVDKQLVGRGDVVVVDEKIGVTLHDSVKNKPR